MAVRVRSPAPPRRCGRRATPVRTSDEVDPSKQEQQTMQPSHDGSTRRQFLKAAGIGAATVVASGGVLTATRGGVAAASLPPVDPRTRVTVRGGNVFLSATDGYITVPGREHDPLYIFGFIPVPNDTVSNLENDYKGRAQHIAPILDTSEGTDVYLKLSNLGLIQRPDLTDSHTLHWHGFRTPTALFDGVPEVSIAVPINRQFTYFYRPHNAGTYMYHCHFEDVEHVQMGMTSIVFVRPASNPNWAYNDSSTAYDRHFAILLNEIWSNFHDGDRDIQETIPTDYDPQWFTLNGRCYPQTVLPNDDSSLDSSLRILTPNANNGDDEPSQPVSALIQVNPGERVLLRLANLGYQQHAMELPGIPMRVVGQDATFLGPNTTLGVTYNDRRYTTNTLYIGPGEARDVLLTAPAYSALAPSGSDMWGTYNRYFFRNRDYRRVANNGDPGAGGANGAVAGLGGMATEVRVYAPGSAVPAPVPDSGRIPPNLTYVH
jgi:FtsP/CotA-like multicopper oxidase with cupredoxin domain